jgi:replication factor A3
MFLSDLELYNEAVKIINELPQFFPVGLPQHE